jgi:leucyl aminopeptidase
MIAGILEAGDFKGKLKETLALYPPKTESGPGRILLVGLGKEEDLDIEAFRRAIAEAAIRGRKLRTGRLAFALPLAGNLPVAEQARAVVESSHLALYEFREYRSKPPEDTVDVEMLVLIGHDDTPNPDLENSVAVGHLAAECAVFCRDLGNTPAWDATPTWIAEMAEQVAEETGLMLTVLEHEDMVREGMGGLLGVARGSAQPPKLVVLEHNGDRDDLDTICLVGKGVTFDTGGISIKPSQNMHEMKFDKCGACTVIATMRAVGTMELPLRVVGITPLTENMPSGTSYRPGDVLECANGKTIEVLNTDAEGRLILADALAYATRYEPKAIVDLATLTGACMIALGKHCAGLMTPDDDLAETLRVAGEAVGERVWRLPLFDDYREQIKSDVADMKNVGGKDGGAITAACLLREFVEEYPWAHLDIAGVAWRDSERDYLRKGGTGFGVRLLIEFLRNWSSGD